MSKHKINKITIEDFESLYKVMENSFPSIERRDFEGQKKLFNEGFYNVIGCKDSNDKVSAFLAFWKFDEFNFVEHFAVDESLRGEGIGTKLFNHYLESTDKLTILEVEPPEDEISTRRIKYYERMGMKMNDYDYMQPPLQQGKPLIPLKIMSYENELMDHEFNNIKRCIYNNVYKYEY